MCNEKGVVRTQSMHTESGSMCIMVPSVDRPIDIIICVRGAIVTINVGSLRLVLSTKHQPFQKAQADS